MDDELDIEATLRSGKLVESFALAGVVSSKQDKAGGSRTFLVEAFFSTRTGMNLKPLRKGGMARQNSGRAMAPIMIG